MGCRRMLHAGPRITEAAAAFSSILLSLFFVFWELPTDTVEDDVIAPWLLLQNALGRAV